MRIAIGQFLVCGSLGTLARALLEEGALPPCWNTGGGGYASVISVALAIPCRCGQRFARRRFGSDLEPGGGLCGAVRLAVAGEVLAPAQLWLWNHAGRMLLSQSHLFRR